MYLLKIGEVAKRAKVSVRTLNHYDHIGLLKPSALSDSGHRLYKEQDIEKLQQIISLKSIGLSLNEIERLLKQGGFGLKETLSVQREAIQFKIENFKKMERMLQLLLKKLDNNYNLDIKELLTLMNEVKKMEEMYTPEQLKKLQERLEQFPDEVKRVEKEWPILFSQFEKALHQGLSLECSEVQKLAEKAQHFIDLFTGGEKEIEKKLDQFYEKNQQSALTTWGVSKEVFDFAYDARKIFNVNKSKR